MPAIPTEQPLLSERLQQILLRVSCSPALDSGDTNTASDLLLDAACDGLSIARSSIWLSEPGQGLRCLRLRLRSIDHPEQSQPSLVLTDNDYPAYFAALASERAIVADDAHQHPATREFRGGYLIPLGIGAMLDIPLRHRGRMIGIICCEHVGGPRPWQPTEITFTANLADLFGRVVTAGERLAYEQQLEQANATLEQRVTARTLELEQALDEQRNMQRQLVENEKMAALGQLVTGVAHEVNSPLGVAVTGVSHCITELAELDHRYRHGKLTESDFNQRLSSLQQGLTLVEGNLQRAARLVTDFKRTAADQSNDDRQRFLLDDYLLSISNSLSPLFRHHGVQLQLELPSAVQCDSYPGALAQIITNLATNSMRYGFGPGFSGKATLLISASQVEEDIYLSINDNGLGMSEVVRQRVFEPFFTTGRAAGGTGLGLAIVHNLVTNTLGGQIRLDSAPNAGCHIEIRFPRCAPTLVT
ncbi:MAG: GAF domain-containing sensor histidine kinase [Gammaproteobacteria bacterium]|nr:GAF domain-containing sensor histidine kinase [Gammaproteobacteria bacterium]